MITLKEAESWRNGDSDKAWLFTPICIIRKTASQTVVLHRLRKRMMIFRMILNKILNTIEPMIGIYRVSPGMLMEIEPGILVIPSFLTR
jgi:hypothetical protein